jgi:hypothetical protein
MANFYKNPISVFLAIFLLSGFLLYEFHWKNYVASDLFKRYCASDEAKPIIIRDTNVENELNIGSLRSQPQPKHAFISDSFENEKLEDLLFLSGLPKTATILFRDEKYSLVTLEYLDRYGKWWIEFLDKNKLKFHENYFDCDNYSDLFMVLFILSSRRYELSQKSQIACGTLIVETVEAFAGIPAQSNAWHSLNIIWTDAGWFVIEPQNGTYISLSSYPNKKGIKAVVF